MSRYLVWDFDGTLGYRVGQWTGALLEVLRQDAPACNATAALIRPHLQTGYPWHAPHQQYPVQSADQWWESLAPIFERAFSAVGVAPSQAHTLARRVRAAYTTPTHWRLFDDTLPTLDRLSDLGWTHLLLSNHVPELPLLLDHLGIARPFACVFNSAETCYEKPHPEAFANVLRVVAGAEAVWMIGDNVTADVAGAQAAGIPAILVRSHHPDARHSCASLSEVIAIVSGDSE